MTGWSPHWPTVLASLGSVFIISFAKALAEQFAAWLVKRRKDSE
jgi:hypothetical protein